MFLGVRSLVLQIGGTKIREPPAGLTVDGDLDLYRTDITKLPEGLTVGGQIRLK